MTTPSKRTFFPPDGALVLGFVRSWALPCIFTIIPTWGLASVDKDIKTVRKEINNLNIFGRLLKKKIFVNIIFE